MQSQPQIQCSTLNTSHIRNKNSSRHGVISERDWSQTQNLLRQHHITNRDIADSTGVALATVNRALGRQADRVNHGDVTRVRTFIEAALRERGWSGTSNDLWDEYDYTHTCGMVAAAIEQAKRVNF